MKPCDTCVESLRKFVRDWWVFPVVNVSSKPCCWSGVDRSSRQMTVDVVCCWRQTWRSWSCGFWKLWRRTSCCMRSWREVLLMISWELQMCRRRHQSSLYQHQLHYPGHIHRCHTSSNGRRSWWDASHQLSAFTDNSCHGFYCTVHMYQNCRTIEQCLYCTVNRQMSMAALLMMMMILQRHITVKEESHSSQCRVDGPSWNSCKTSNKLCLQSPAENCQWWWYVKWLRQTAQRCSCREGTVVKVEAEV